MIRKMSFEIRERDVLGRIGRFETKSGIIETPLLLPVISSTIQLIPPKRIQELFGCTALMTNAYIIRKHFEDETAEKGLHTFLDFDGVIMTDSGAYQTLVYGDAEVSSKEIVQFQEDIRTDIATILDVPTGWDVPEEYARYTVDETLRRAEELSEIKTCDDISWIGPVQGGRYLDLVAHSAREMAKLPFELHALGSPTPVMEQYLFSTLMEMIMTAKKNLPAERPLHLFGAGHPFMFALAVALGCDLFDSAAYAKYAREGRYMTARGTMRLSGMRYFSCSCPLCGKYSPGELLEMEQVERVRVLAKHNLYVSFSEIRLIKQAIVEGRLWEHLELRAHGHPSLLSALKGLSKYKEYIEAQSPMKKRSGLYFFSSLGLARPEIVRHKKRLTERYSPPKTRFLVLVPQTRVRPFHKSNEYKKVLADIQQNLGDVADHHVCIYAAPFGIAPIELDEVYPLSQYEIVTPLDLETLEYTARRVAEYIMAVNYERIILYQDVETWKGMIAAACRQACKKKGTPLAVFKR
ncbi:MAG: tRNA guanosine(15) transglycosylase TgtA [Candidatus Bathyarchaeota archaeon]|nr:MAG: tRNA guanosine(15) transglycosylase TgtA [Candidatus Bathyarchaeota archaeon]